MGRALSSLARDPVIARSALIRFHQASAQQSRPGKLSGGKVRASSPDTASSDSAPGLPLRVGDVHRPEPLAPLPAHLLGRRSGGLVRQIQAILAALFIGAALGIVGFTAWRVISGRPPAAEGPAVVPQALTEPPVQEPAVETPEVPLELVEPAAAEDPPAARAVESLAEPEAEPEAEALQPRIGPDAAVEPIDGSEIEDIPEEEPPPAVVERGQLTVGSNPRAQVLIDGDFVRHTPLFKYWISAGVHTVTLVSETGERTSFTVDVLADKEVRRIWSFESDGWVED
jgi:hypothetical protein